MKLIRHRRTLLIAVALTLGSLLVTGVALAGPAARHHRRQVVRHQRVVRVVRRRIRRTFAPKVITRAAEVSAVELDPVTQQFMQVTFDRGRATGVGSGSITLQQKQNAAVWRTQTFSVPSGAVVTLDRRTVSLSQIPTGSWVRIESSGPAGGSESVVRVDAFSGREAPLPAMSS